jgi:hypothetical protein
LLVGMIGGVEALIGGVEARLIEVIEALRAKP